MNRPDPLRAMFERAIELPPAQRGAFLREHCPDPDLRARLERLLTADTDPCDPLRAVSVSALANAIGEDAWPQAQPGERIGGWTLEARLGEGGTATVFRASREVEGLRQQAAIKLLRRGLHSPDTQRQFRRERQALAALSHPNIAHLIDGGVSALGIPYLVVEYVDGVPITVYARDARLDLRARLALMVAVCRAVAAAHRHLIVHRDLKPANIFAAADGTVKLLDFGIAKLLDDEDALPADATRTGYAPLTPGYAAPEQYAGTGISTATDVYALGVVLHELLLGVRPSPERPLRPSARIDDGALDPQFLPLPRATLRSALRGDLDNIVLKALSEEPERRYAGAGDLADDIQRHLDAQPVHAHPPSRWYRTRKFVQRHRGGVIVTAALALGMLTSLVLALWQAGEARQQARAAQVQSQRAEAVSAFLVGLFDNQIPLRPGEATPGTDVLLERGVQQAMTELHGQPELQASLLVALARVYDHLARGDAARPMLERAIAVAGELQPPDPPLLARALSERGALDLQRDRYREALDWFEKALALQSRGDSDPLQHALTLDRKALALSRLGRHEAALAAYRQALGLRRLHLPADDPEIIHSNRAIGSALIRAGRGEEAEDWLARADGAATARFGEEHVKTAHYRKERAVNLLYRGQLARGLPMLEQAVAMERTLYPPGHPDRGQGLNALGANLWLAGRLDDAEQALGEGIALLRGADQGESLGMGFFLGNLARVAEARGDTTRAASLTDEALRITRLRVDEAHERVAVLRLQQARLHARTDPTAENLQRLSDIADAVLRGDLRTGMFQPRAQVEARHALAWRLATEGHAEAAAEARHRALAQAPPDALDPLLFEDAAALARWQSGRGDTAAASALASAWLARATEQLPDDHYALAPLRHLAAGSPSP